MSRLTTPASEDITAEAESALGTVGRQFGFVPNMFAMLASNPAVLDVVMSLQGSLGRVLDAKTRHTIALAVSEANGCDYCLAVHSYVSAELGGMSSDDIDLARSGSSIDPKRSPSRASLSGWSKPVGRSAIPIWPPCGAPATRTRRSWRLSPSPFRPC